MLLPSLFTMVIASLTFLAEDEEPKPIPFVELREVGVLAFDEHIFPIVSGKCATCHDREGGLAEGDLDVLTVESLLKGGKHGPGVVKGKGEESLIVLRSSHRAKPIMPPKDEGEPLTSEELSLMKVWIDQGLNPGKVLEPSTMKKKDVVFEEVAPQVQPVNGVDLSKDGAILAVAVGKSVLLVKPRTGETIQRFPEQKEIISSVALSPDGQWLAAGAYEKVLVWHRPTGSEGWAGPESLGPTRERTLCLSFRADSQMLAGGSGTPTAGGDIVVWNLADRTIASTLRDLHSDVVTTLEFSPDGKTIASGSADKFVKILPIEKPSGIQSLEGHVGHVLSLSWRHDMKQLASAGADAKIKIWNVELGEQIRTIEGTEREVTAVEYVGESPSLVASGGDRRVRRIHADSGKVEREYVSESYLLSVCVSDDGKIIAAGTQDGLVIIWNGDDGTVMHRLKLLAK